MHDTSKKSMRLAMVVSRFNEHVTNGLKQGAFNYLSEQGLAVAPSDVYAAPGAFEIPLLAKALAKTGNFDGIICLGCVTKHETAHFEFVSLGATMGLMQATLDTEVPMAFGILTTYTDEQAKARSSDNAHNKGIEAAAAVVESIRTLDIIRRSPSEKRIN